MVILFKLWWGRLSGLPMGKWLFSKIISFFIPYTGTIKPYVEKVEPGYAQVSVSDHRRIRNHLRSYHAIALANLGELTTGLAVHFSLGEHGRAILTKLTTEYFKKGRGKITAISKLAHVNQPQEGPIVVLAELFDEQNNLVSRVEATWLVGSNHSKSNS